MGKRFAIAGFLIALAALSLPRTGSGQEWRQHYLLLRAGDKTWKYSHDQLKAMTSAVHVSYRGTKKNPAIPLDVLVTKDPQLPMDRIIGVVIVGIDKVLFLEGDKLAYLKHLVLKFGPNHLTLAPQNEETERSLKPLWGKPRIEDVERVDIFERR